MIDRGASFYREAWRRERAERQWRMRALRRGLVAFAVVFLAICLAVVLLAPPAPVCP